jgi:hypothetical protein
MNKEDMEQEMVKEEGGMRNEEWELDAWCRGICGKTIALYTQYFDHTRVQSVGYVRSTLTASNTPSSSPLSRIGWGKAEFIRRPHYVVGKVEVDIIRRGQASCYPRVSFSLVRALD